MISAAVTCSYEANDEVYKWCMSGGEFTVGDVIRKARTARRWNQTRLGAEAAKFQLPGRALAINKSTVSKVEKDPYTSEFGTVWRLLAALGVKFSDVELLVGQPFVAQKHDSSQSLGEGRVPTKRRRQHG